MKTNGWIFFAMCMMLFVACDDDDKVVPPEVIENAFHTQYPTATEVKWERAGVFRKVDFKVDAKEYEAWYNMAGVWLQTESTKSYSTIPSEIKDFLNEQIEVMVKTSKDSYSVSDGFFETYLANNLKKVFEIIEIKEEALTETEERIY